MQLLLTGFGDSANGIDVSTRAIVLGHVASEGLVDVWRPEDEETSGSASNPQHQLREKVGSHHSDPGLTNARFVNNNTNFRKCNAHSDIYK